MLERSSMSQNQRDKIDKEESAQIGVLPELDHTESYYVKLWSDLRASTPSDHPISLDSLAMIVGRDGVIDLLPLIQLMDHARFEWIGNKHAAERKRREREAKAKRRKG